MPITTALTERLQLDNPVFQAPMAGGGDTPDLVAAVSRGGGLGFLGAAYLSGEQIAEAAAAVRRKTARPFGINLFAPLPSPRLPRDPGPALERVAPFFAELGLAAPTLPEATPLPFAEQLAACLESGAAAFSFTFGPLPVDAVAAIKKRGLFLLGTATTVDEAVALEKAGCDGIITQGSEAGGHRGTFAGSFEAGLVGTMALVPQVVDRVKVPVVASGGIMDGRGIAAAVALGAQAVQLGTAFLTCRESGVSEAYKAAIAGARECDTRLTRAFSGRPARGIVNRFMETVEGRGADDAILPFPMQNALTRPLRAAAAREGRAEFLSLWAGQALRLARRGNAADLVAALSKEADEAIGRLAARCATVAQR